MFLHPTQLVSVWMKTLFVSFLLVGFFCALTGSAHADNVKALLKQAGTELRNAQKLMFDGKNDEAIAILPRSRLSSNRPNPRILETCLSRPRKTNCSS